MIPRRIPPRPRRPRFDRRRPPDLGRASAAPAAQLHLPGARRAAPSRARRARARALRRTRPDRRGPARARRRDLRDRTRGPRGSRRRPGLSAGASGDRGPRRGALLRLDRRGSQERASRAPAGIRSGPLPHHGPWGPRADTGLRRGTGDPGSARVRGVRAGCRPSGGWPPAKGGPPPTRGGRPRARGGCGPPHRHAARDGLGGGRGGSALPREDSRPEPPRTGGARFPRRDRPSGLLGRDSRFDRRRNGDPSGAREQGPPPGLRAGPSRGARTGRRRPGPGGRSPHRAADRRDRCHRGRGPRTPLLPGPPPGCDGQRQDRGVSPGDPGGARRRSRSDLARAGDFADSGVRPGAEAAVSVTSGRAPLGALRTRASRGLGPRPCRRSPRRHRAPLRGLRPGGRPRAVRRGRGTRRVLQATRVAALRRPRSGRAPGAGELPRPSCSARPRPRSKPSTPPIAGAWPGSCCPSASPRGRSRR